MEIASGDQALRQVPGGGQHLHLVVPCVPHLREVETRTAGGGGNVGCPPTCMRGFLTPTCVLDDLVAGGHLFISGLGAWEGRREVGGYVFVRVVFRGAERAERE